MVGLVVAFAGMPLVADEPASFIREHCWSCHDSETKQGGLDLSQLPLELDDAERFGRWVRIHDRIAAGEMPPPTVEPPAVERRTAATRALREALVRAERKRLEGEVRSGLRRLTRFEYEHTIRDLFDMPGIALQGDLPPDGSAHGFDNNSDALDISHVNLAKYLEAAERVLEMAVAIQPTAPESRTQRISLANPHGFVAHVLLHGDGVLLKDKRPDPEFPPAGEQMHIDQGAHERIGSFHNGATVGLFRHEDESFSPYFNEFVTIYPARYRIRTSLWSFQWDQGEVLPSRGTEAARLSIVQLTGDGRGGGHPSTVLGYYDAPSLKEQLHEVVTWLNPKETIGFNAASLAPGGQTRGPKRALGFTGPAVACDYLEVEGPLFEHWPPTSHRRLFGELPLVEFDPAAQPGVRPPRHSPPRQAMFMGKNRPDPVSGVWTVASARPLEDAERLLGDFLPRAFRRPVDAAVRGEYVALVAQRLEAGDCFENALRWAYRAALCSPDFLYHVEPAGPLDDHALASRLSYFLWSSLPDEPLRRLADEGALRRPETLREQVERMLDDPRSQRFVESFLGQWLKLRQIAANDPDRKLYPEFNAYLQDSMVAESHAFFRELLERDLDARQLIVSDFVMINERLAAHYGIPGVSGSQIRRVPIGADSPRGGLLSQAALLKVTANGTTTSPVPRGAFVLSRLLGRPPEPPPPNVPAIEPDVRGATTIREQLDRHRADSSCAGCHAKLDPPGFALESFDVIGGFRDRYRTIGEGDAAPRGAIDPFIPLSFKLGPAVDASGRLTDGREFRDFNEFRALLAADTRPLLENLARQLAIYASGRDLMFSDRDEVEQVVEATLERGGGVRTLIHELVQSPLFQSH